MTDQGPPSSTPPGWYPDGSGGQRYWDGTQWTANSAPPSPAAPTHASDGDKWWHNPVVVGLFLLCCSPIGLLLTWLNPKWSTKTKAIITAVLVVLAIAGGVVAASTPTPITDSTTSTPWDMDPEPDGSQAADDEAEDSEPLANPDEGVMEIIVTSTGSSSANSISYMDPTSGSFQISQENGKPLPWTKRFEDVDSVPLGFNMNAQQNGGGDLKCVVKLDGKVIAENTSSGSYAVVTCAP